MEAAIPDYNSSVTDAQKREGRLASVAPMGSRLPQSDRETQ
jgi:hypothetical protein